MKSAILTLTLSLLSLPVSAADINPSPERLELFPNGRAAYQDKFDAASERYEVEARNLLDDLYEYKGERSGSKSSSKTAEPMAPEADLDDYIDDAGEASKIPAQTPADPPAPAAAQ